MNILVKSMIVKICGLPEGVINTESDEDTTVIKQSSVNRPAMHAKTLDYWCANYLKKEAIIINHLFASKRKGQQAF